MKFSPPILFLLLLLSWPDSVHANLDWLCERVKLEVCGQRRFTRSSGASIPSESSSYRLNPSSVNVDKGFGFEFVGAPGMLDYGLVTGTGKVGAAVSPTSLEDTFFANLPIEDTTDYVNRKRQGSIYKSQKYNLATATQLFPKSRFIKPSIGFIGKYNKLSKKFSPGAGFTLGMGPLSIGYAVNKDDFYKDYGYSIVHARYETRTLGLGLKLPNFALDYSRVENILDNYNNTTIIILSGTVFWRSFMFTYGQRTETSYRPDYDLETDTYTFTEKKYTAFLGVQYSFRKKFLVGLFSNYFLYNELSLGLTAFF